MAAYQYIYVMKGLGKTYAGGREVLKDVWLSFLPGAKIGVLGPNGAGKSTLLRIMAGEEREFAGEAWAADGARVGYLPQEPALDPTKDVFGNVVERAGRVVEGAGRDQGAARPFRGSQRALCRGSFGSRNGCAGRRAGGNSRKGSIRRAPEISTAPSRSQRMRCTGADQHRSARARASPGRCRRMKFMDLGLSQRLC